jgi:hypothetical protein
LGFELNGNIHLEATARIVEIDGSPVQAGTQFRNVLYGIPCNSVTVL